MKATRFARLAMLSLLIAVAACSTDYVTGKRTFSLVGEGQEIAMGREADPQIVAEYGLYDDKELAALIDKLGQQMAKVSQRPQLDYTFRVLDSPVVNAFALPGGYVYVTRGILAHFNSEDELAGVLGHEIGHVVARHSAEQMSRQQLAGLGLGLGAMVSETFAQYVQVAGVGVGLLFLSFSRDQESESDRLGVEYSTKLGYDSHRMAGFFGTLARLGDDSGQSIPGFMSTHPDPGDREVNVNRLTEEWQKQVPYQPLNTDPDAYLQMLDGVVYGADPRQGYVDNGTFYHPQMRFQFPVPSGWTLVNSPSTVQLANSEKSAIVQLRLGQSESAVAEADKFSSGEGIAVRKREASTVNGLRTVIVESDVTGNDQEIRVLSYFIEKDSSILVFHGFSLAADFAAHTGAFVQVMAGVKVVTDDAVINVQPKRVRVKEAPRAADLASVLSALGVAASAHKELAILNGRDLKAQVERGTLIKVVGE